MLKTIKKNYNKFFTTSIITSIVFLALGIFLFLKPETTISTISYIIGIIILLLGAFSISKYYTNKNKSNIDFSLIYGILSIIVGIIIILNPTAIATIITFVLGFWIVINSIIKIQYSLDLKNHDNKAWLITLIIGLLTLIWGLVLVFNPFGGALDITKLIGLFIIIYSILDIVECFILNKNIKDITKDIKKEFKKVTKKAKKIIEE